MAQFSDWLNKQTGEAEEEQAPAGFSDWLNQATPEEPKRRRSFTENLSRVKPADALSRIQSDPAWERLMEAQSVLQQYMQRAEAEADNPEVSRRVSMAGDAVQDHIAELARKYDVTPNFVASLARGETPGPAPANDERKPFQDRLSDFISNEIMTARQAGEAVGEHLPKPVRRIGGNVFTGVTSLLEAFQLPGDVNRTAMTNVGERLQEGERPEWAETGEGFSLPREVWELGQIAAGTGEAVKEVLVDNNNWITYMPDLRWGDKYLGFRNSNGESAPHLSGQAASGRELLQQFDLEEPAVDFIMRWAEPLGITDREQAASIAGVMAEMGTDPLLAADFGFVGARALKLAGAGRTAGGKKAINLLEQMGEDMLRVTSPAGQLNIAREGLGVVDRATKSVNRSIANLLDARVSRSVLPGTDIGMAASFGIDPADMGIQVRDLIYGRGVSPFDDDSLRWLYGGSDVDPMSAYGGTPGAVDRAHGAERAVQRRIAHGIEQVDRAIVSRIGEPKTHIFHGKKVAMPNSHQLTENGIRLRSLLHQNAWDLLDNYGVPQMQQGFDEVLPRVRKAAELYGFDTETVVDAFKEATVAARATVLDTGYLASRYDEFVGLADRAAESLGYDPARMRRLMEAQYAGTDLQAFRATGEVPEGRLRLRVTQDDIEQYGKFDEELRSMMQAEGFSPALNPLTYLNSVREGYMRRVIGAKVDPNAMYKALGDSRSLAVVSQAAMPDLPAGIGTKFGDEAGAAIGEYLSARPSHGMLSTDELAGIIRERTGREVTAREVADVIYQDDRNYTLLMETEDLLRSEGAQVPYSQGTGGAQYSRTRGLSARKEFNEDELTKLLQVYDLPVAMAQLGRVASRNVRADEMLQSAFKFLSENEQIIPPERIARETVGNIGRGKRIDGDRIWQFQNRHGTQYVAIPENHTSWGPLAGKAIPYKVAREVIKTVSMPSHIRQTRWEQLVNNYRKMNLSPLPTTVVNILGNLNFIRQSGVDFFDLLGNLPRAVKARADFRNGGRLKGLEEVENMMSFFHDRGGSLSGSVMRDRDSRMLDLMEELASATSMDDLAKRTGGVMDKATEWTEKFTTDPRFGGFLGWFAWGEEVTRLSAAYAVRDKLIRRGLSPSEAQARAAHVANNSAGDYGSLGAIPAFFKRYGLSMFPQFAWFNAGRTARQAVERPSGLVKPEYARRLYNAAAIEGGEEEQERLTAMMEQWQRFEQPLAVKLPGRDPGEYAIANFSRVNPLGLDTETLIVGPVMLEAYLPIIEAVVANTVGEGEAFWSGKYGRRVYDESKPGSQAAQTAGFLTQTYLFPGHQRMVRNILETAEYRRYKDQTDAYNQIMGKYQNRDAAQLIGRMLGFSTFKAGTQGAAGELSFRRRLSELEREEGPGRTDFLKGALGLPGARTPRESMERQVEDVGEYRDFVEELLRHRR